MKYKTLRESAILFTAFETCRRDFSQTLENRLKTISLILWEWVYFVDFNDQQMEHVGGHVKLRIEICIVSHFLANFVL